MSDAMVPAMTDAASTSPFTMVGDPAAMVCEGDVCFIPGLAGDGTTDAAASPTTEEQGATPGR